MHLIKYSCIILLLVSLSCRNRQRQADKILEDFKKVNSELDSLAAKNAEKKGLGAFEGDGSWTAMTRQQAYDSLKRKFAGTGRFATLLQMEYHIGDFLRYLKELKRQFYILCGDNTGSSLPEKNEENVALTNKFFHTEPATFLISFLLHARKSLADNTQSDSLRIAIKKIGAYGGTRSEYTGEQWRKKYFKDTSPIAAITIVNSFENQIRNIEQQILSDYLKQ